MTRSVEWFEQRHVQMARRIGNYRRGIKQLQRAHDRQADHWRVMFDRWSAAHEEITRLRTELRKAQDAPVVRRWNRDCWCVTIGMFLTLVGLAIAAILNHAMVRP